MSKHIAITKFRPANWLKKAGYAPQVFVFRNLESGQVLYSQFPTFTWAQVEKNFQRPNWENKKPSTRRDIWKCMAVVDLPDYESSVKLYQNLCRLRYLRDVTLSKQAKEMRKKNEFGHTCMVLFSVQTNIFPGGRCRLERMSTEAQGFPKIHQGTLGGRVENGR